MWKSLPGCSLYNGLPPWVTIKSKNPGGLLPGLISSRKPLCRSFSTTAIPWSMRQGTSSFCSQELTRQSFWTVLNLKPAGIAKVHHSSDMESWKMEKIGFSARIAVNTSLSPPIPSLTITRYQYQNGWNSCWASFGIKASHLYQKHYVLLIPQRNTGWTSCSCCSKTIRTT